MKSFRSEKQQKHASAQVIITLLVLLISIVLVRFLPRVSGQESPQTQETAWETSVIQLP